MQACFEASEINNNKNKNTDNWSKKLNCQWWFVCRNQKILEKFFDYLGYMKKKKNQTYRSITNDRI